MKKLAHDRRDLKDRYGVVVIGSGYGGAICAARLAEAGRSVCLLERGREWTTGEFPDDKKEMASALRTEHNRNGLFDFRSGKDIDVLSGNGLGGTSLINANVVIRPEDDVFDQQRWPAGIRQAYADGELKAYGDKVVGMLKASDAEPPGGWPAKVEALKKSAEACDASWKPVPIAVNMTAYDNAPNHVGVVQQLCTQCGDCVTGCNVGAKNTLDKNYLPLARNEGAAIHTCLEVQFIVEAEGGGYYVYARDELNEWPEPVVIHGQAVVVSAGALGSTGILLRSRDRGLALSERLGQALAATPTSWVSVTTTILAPTCWGSAITPTPVRPLRSARRS